MTGLTEAFWVTTRYAEVVEISRRPEDFCSGRGAVSIPDLQEEALEFFAPIDRIARHLRTLVDVGLGYVRLGQPATTLSGGEAQRVAIARALATGNPVLLADEPTGELDFRTGVSILELLREQAAAGSTVLIVTHNREISRVADRVVELSGGHIVSDGPPAGGRTEVADLQW